MVPSFTSCDSDNQSISQQRLDSAESIVAHCHRSTCGPPGIWLAPGDVCPHCESVAGGWACLCDAHVVPCVDLYSRAASLMVTFVDSLCAIKCYNPRSA